MTYKSVDMQHSRGILVFHKVQLLAHSFTGGPYSFAEEHVFVHLTSVQSHSLCSCPEKTKTKTKQTKIRNEMVRMQVQIRKAVSTEHAFTM